MKNEKRKMFATDKELESTFLEVFEWHYEHTKALAIFLFGVLMMGKVSTRQSLKVPVPYLLSCSPAVVNDHFMYRYIGNSIKQNANAHIEPEIATGHDAELHIEPTRNGEDQGEKVVALKETVMRLMVIAVQGPAERVHHVFVRKPSHELHEPEGCYDPEYVDEDLHFRFKLQVASYKLW
jgi:hypothetical protein